MQTIVAVPSQGTVLIDLIPDDPEFVSVKEQVFVFAFCSVCLFGKPLFFILLSWLTMSQIGDYVQLQLMKSGTQFGTGHDK